MTPQRSVRQRTVHFAGAQPEVVCGSVLSRASKHRKLSGMRIVNAVSHGSNEQFIAIVAHELRYPLVPIRNAAALLKQNSLDATTIRRVAEIIERQTNGMHRLIGDLVDVSRMQLGVIELHRARVTMSAIVECAIESVTPLASERGHSLSVSVSSEPIYLDADLLRVGRAVHNIIDNASKYTDELGSIHVRAERQGNEAVITVSDTGGGIPAADLERIFGLFVQSEQQDRIEAGLGLGLYLARHLIEAHQGTVTAASDGVGRGSVFTMRLPCEPPAPASDRTADAERADDRSRADHGIALARQLFELRSVEHGDFSPRITNDAQLLQLAGRLGDAFAAHAEHVRDELLRHLQLIARETIERQQQPAAQLLFERVMPVADRGLRHLRNERLGVTQQDVEHFAVAIEFLLEPVAGQAIGVAGALHDGAARRGLAAHEQRDPDGAFIADHGDFGGRSILHDVQQRHD
jgi:nitrogen-specific signal transduction histidine kinase